MLGSAQGAVRCGIQSQPHPKPHGSICPLGKLCCGGGRCLSRSGGIGMWRFRGLLWREPCMAGLRQRDTVGLAALACHLCLSHCEQTFSLDGNMPEIAPLQIVFI